MAALTDDYEKIDRIQNSSLELCLLIEAYLLMVIFIF